MAATFPDAIARKSVMGALTVDVIVDRQAIRGSSANVDDKNLWSWAKHFELRDTSTASFSFRIT